MARNATGRPFAAWLDKRINDLGMRTADVARQVDVDGVQVMRWRRGKATPTPTFLGKLADLFGADLEELERLAYLPDRQSVATTQAVDAERQKWRARYDYVMEKKVPQPLWDAYLAACEALAEAYTHLHQAPLRTPPAAALSDHPAENDDPGLEDGGVGLAPRQRFTRLTLQTTSP